MPDYPPIVPGVTEPGEGSDEMKMLSSLVSMRQQNKKEYESMMNQLAKLFTPTTPMESETRGDVQPFPMSPAVPPLPYPPTA